MKIKSNKLIKVNNFDVLDIKALEKYLSKIALEEYIIKKYRYNT